MVELVVLKTGCTHECNQTDRQRPIVDANFKQRSLPNMSDFSARLPPTAAPAALAAASAGLRQVHRSTQNFPTDQLWAEIDAKNERKLHPPLSFESCPVSVTQLTQASAISFISSG